MSVNIFHRRNIQIIGFHFFPVWFISIFKMDIPIYKYIKELIILQRISKHISVLSGLPFINL